MNPAFMTLFSLTKSNSDLRFLRLVSLDYSVKYSAKVQGIVDAEKALKIALDAVDRSFRSRQRAEANDPDMEAKRLGEARVRSLLFHITNFTQIDITMAAFCLLTKGRPYMTSHREVNLSLYPLMSIVEGGRVSVTVTPAPGGGVRGSMMVTKYLNRDRRDLALFEFLAGGFSVKRKSTTRRKRKLASHFDDEAEERDDESAVDSDESREDAELSDSDDRDRTSSDIGASPTRPQIGYPSTPDDFVVVLHGCSFKPKVRLTTPEATEKNALATLLYFVPFDSLDKASMLRGQKSYSDAVEQAIKDGVLCALGVQYLANVDSMWTQKIAAQDRTKIYNQKLREQAQSIDALKGSSQLKQPSHGADSDDDFNSDSDNDADGADDIMQTAISSSIFARGTPPLASSRATSMSLPDHTPRWLNWRG